MSRIRVMVILCVLLTMSLGFVVFQPKVMAPNPPPDIVSISRAGVANLLTDNCFLVDIPKCVVYLGGYDPSTGMFGPVAFELPHGAGSPPARRISADVYTVTISTFGFTPYFVGAMGTALSWNYVSSTSTLTITVTSILQQQGAPTFYAGGIGVKSVPQGSVDGLLSFYAAGIMVDFNPRESFMNGGFVSFVGDDFNMGPGSTLGTLVISISGDAWRTGTTGEVKFFMPAAAPASFGKTLDDVEITLDGAGVSATTAAGTNNGQSGRIWTFSIPFSTHQVQSNANPTTHGPPVGGFMEPVNTLAIAAPYLALFGVVAAVAIVVVKPWKKREN